MVQTIVKPLKENFDMEVLLPADYVGKNVHVLFYIDEEIKNATASIIPKKRPSDFFGILNREEGDKFDKHIKEIRGEWDRSI